jgi:hypothetical protein
LGKFGTKKIEEMVPYDKDLTVKQKALRINLDKRIYGSFAEIGAGQDVAAHFFKAGGASGTIAKTISAYDTVFSDAIYGPEESGRYVCEPRLMKMLHREYNLVNTRLGEKRGEKSLFFAFADTVVALNFAKTNEGHGWIGLRFQLEEGGASNDVVIHVRMHDNDSLLQQQALGIIGVNLIYGCFNYYDRPEILLQSLIDDLSRDRVEIDMVRFEGPDFARVDNRLMSLKLVSFGLTEAALFGPDGQNLLASEVCYKKNIAVIRGRFRPVTRVFEDMLDKGVKHFLADPEVSEERLLVISELTLHNLLSGNETHEIDEKDFLDRVDILCSLGQTVLISNFHEYYKLVAFLSQLTRQKIGLILGVPNLEFIFDEAHYDNLPGGILEGFATLFSRKVKLFVYPTQRDGITYHCDNFVQPEKLQSLYHYFMINNKLEDIQDADFELLSIISDEILAQIKAGTTDWERAVPPAVAQVIKEKCLFGYPCEVPRLK